MKHHAAWQDDHDDHDQQRLRAVLDAVRSSGLSAHPRAGQSISDLVLLLSIHHDWNPVALQALVRDYADRLESIGEVAQNPKGAHLGIFNEQAEDR